MSAKTKAAIAAREAAKAPKKVTKKAAPKKTISVPTSPKFGTWP